MSRNYGGKIVTQVQRQLNGLGRVRPTDTRVAVIQRRGEYVDVDDAERAVCVFRNGE